MQLTIGNLFIETGPNGIDLRKEPWFMRLEWREVEVLKTMLSLLSVTPEGQAWSKDNGQA